MFIFKIYVLSRKVWLNNKYIKNKEKQKLEIKLFRLFQVLYPTKKYAYKLKLLKRQKIHNVFYMLLLKQIITINKQVNKNIIEFKVSNNKKYKLEIISNSTIYTKKSKISHLSDF